MPVLRIRLLLPGVLLSLLLPALLACGLWQRQEPRAPETPAEVPQELRVVWEVWQLLSRDFGGQQEVESRSLSEGAIEGMLQALGDHEPPFLSRDDYDASRPDLGGVWQAWRALTQRLQGEEAPDPDRMKEAAIQGMLEALGNPYTTYLPPPQYQLEASSYSASFEGIGAYVNPRDGQIVIVAPMPGSPAEKAGILPGDTILAVNGTSTAGMSLPDVILRIRGPRGTAVELLVLHPGEQGPVTISVVRDIIKQTAVYWQPLQPGIAYLRVAEFLDTTEQDVTGALKAIAAQGSNAIILDLRRNPGGLLATTVAVASQFLTDGLVAYHVDGHGKRTDLAVKQGGVAPTAPMVVLIDRGSASGSELLAGALQDHGRAILIGSRTFGKGSVNELRRLSDGSGLYLTTALWYTPDGRLIEGKGMDPDVVVPMDLRIPLGSALDTQLAGAVQRLRAPTPVAAG
ncbi:MAG: S41 family peptidase [Chloroflexi bacterium]|nr:S41 family peptidase [Chloroflexota bacterium]